MTPLFKAIREAAPTISVGMLTADLLNLGAEIALLEALEKFEPEVTELVERLKKNHLA